MAPEVALKKYKTRLNAYEEKEIMKYPEIYFVGSASVKIRPHNISKVNFGFDLANTHHYRANIGDHIAYRYEIRGVLGKGAFGQVLLCYDHKEKREVAIKVIVNTRQMHQQGKAELEILRELNDADKDQKSYIIRVMDHFTFRRHVCGVMEILGQNLYEYVRANFFRPLPIRHVRIIARQLAKALAFIHSQGIVHCDLKPENIVLLKGSNTKIRLVDFGSACRVGQKHFDYI